MSDSDHQDVFAVLANTDTAQREVAQPFPATARPTRVFSPRADGDVEVPVAPRMQTQADIEARLQQLRAQYAPFRRRLEGELPAQRQGFNIEEMDFRQESQGEKPGQELAAGHQWERVRVPHFTGPPDRWVGWYKEQFEVTPEMLGGRRVWIRFEAVDYHAHVYINGRYVGSHTGLFAPFEFDITPWVHEGAGNQLVVRIDNEPPSFSLTAWGQFGYTKPLDGNKLYGATGLGWDEAGAGWHHCPPGAGIWQPVRIESRPSVSIKEVFVRPVPGTEEVELTLDIWQTPEGRENVYATLEIIPSNFEGESLGPIQLEIDETMPELSRHRRRLRAPRLRGWSLEEPYLHVARVCLHQAEGGELLDAVDRRFGVRSFAMDSPEENTEAEPRKAGTFYLNEEEIVLRGSNTMGHMQNAVFNGDIERAADDILLAKAANLNFYRLTQRPVQPEIYELADELGFMLQTDLPLFGYIRFDTEAEVIRQSGEMERLVRQHPSSVMVSLINEPLPFTYRPWAVARSLSPAEMREVLRASTARVLGENPDRVVKACDGDYINVAPKGHKPDHHSYNTWYTDHGIHLGRMMAGEMFHLRDGWRGGCGEYGAEGFDTLNVMMNDYPQDWQPKGADDAEWTPEPIVRNQSYSGRGRFYSPGTTAADWVERSQGYQAWAVRAVTDAFRRRVDVVNSTAVHLLIDAWPAGWMKSLMTHRREAKKAWFELADCLTPLAINMHQQRLAIWDQDSVDLDIWVFDERPSAQRDENASWAVRWEVVHGDVRVASGEESVEFKAMASTPVGKIDVAVESASVAVSEAVVRSSLVSEGKAAHTHEVVFEVWPALTGSEECAMLAGQSVAVVGVQDTALLAGINWLALNLGMKILPAKEAEAADLVFIDPSATEGVAGCLESLLKKQGGCVYVLPQGEGALAGFSSMGLEVKVFGGGYHAMPEPDILIGPASRREDNLCTRWWDMHEQRVDHTTRSWISGEGLEHFVSINTLAWSEKESERFFVPAVAQLRTDSGARVVLDQTQMLRVCQGEPRAAWLAVSVLVKSCSKGA